jgi:RimJ/RimL family protein N-acetyltransferase
MGRRPKNELNLIIECTCGQRAGMLALVDIDVASKSAEAGRFFVDQRYSSRGFAVAAMNLLYRMAFSKLELSLVTAAISTSNQGMISWHQHFGMEVVGQAFASEDIRGNGRSILELELSKIQWEKVTAPKMTKFLQNARERFGHFTCLCGSNENTSLL